MRKKKKSFQWVALNKFLMSVAWKVGKNLRNWYQFSIRSPNSATVQKINSFFSDEPAHHELNNIIHGHAKSLNKNSCSYKWHAKQFVSILVAAETCRKTHSQNFPVYCIVYSNAGEKNSVKQETACLVLRRQTVKLLINLSENSVLYFNQTQGD